MKIVRVDETMLETLAPLLAEFRAALRGYTGIESRPDVPSAREELAEFFRAGVPVFAARRQDGTAVGYMALRIEDTALWVEHLYVRPEDRRQGVASLLFAQAEAMARELGEDTVFNFVHPNNDGMIAFLKAKGYTVLNLIEIRKPYRGEKTRSSVRVGSHMFDF